MVTPWLFPSPEVDLGMLVGGVGGGGWRAGGLCRKAVLTVSAGVY